MNFIVILYFAAIITTSVCANLLLKIGSAEPKAVLGFISWMSVAGLAMFGIGGLLYARVLQYVDLHTAQASGALQFAAIVMAAALVLGERIMPLQWAGIGLIFAGVTLTVYYGR